MNRFSSAYIKFAENGTNSDLNMTNASMPMSKFSMKANDNRHNHGKDALVFSSGMNSKNFTSHFSHYARDRQGSGFDEEPEDKVISTDMSFRDRDSVSEDEPRIGRYSQFKTLRMETFLSKNKMKRSK